MALLCHDTDDIVIASAEALAKLTSSGGVPFCTRIVAHTDIIDQLVCLLLRPVKGWSSFAGVIACIDTAIENDVNDTVLRRTASVVLSDLYIPEENRPRFRPYLSSMFRAISKCFEVGALLAPILRATAQIGR